MRRLPCPVLQFPLATLEQCLYLTRTIFDGMDKTRITYLADGTKTGLAGWNGIGVKYRGSFVYEKASPDSSYKLSSVLWDEGVISCGADSTSLTDALFVRDHLGSVRSVVNLSAPASATIWDAILETRDYLPFGTEAVSTTGAAYGTWAQNRWRYEGKETLPYTPAPTAVKDFGARYYDPYTVRWLSPDPKAHCYPEMSPWLYCAGSPLSIVDYDGNVPHAVFYKNKIVIVARYIHNSDSRESASQAVGFWNNKKGVTYTEDGKTYKIHFKLSTELRGIVYDSIDKMTGMYDQDYVYYVEPQKEMGIDEAGSYDNRHVIKVREDYSINTPTGKTSTTGAHEIGHTLEMDHKKVGIMTESQSEDRTSDVPEENIKEMMSKVNRHVANSWIEYMSLLRNLK